MAPGPSSSSIVIDLISSDDEAAPVVQNPFGKRKAVEPAAVELEDDDEEALCMEVDAPAQPALRDAAAPAADADEEDVVFQGRTGDHALLDFPHSRENCAHVKFVPGKEAEHCVQCYCFVCDKPASTCSQWADDHCKATHTSAAWRQARDQAQARARAAAVAPAAPAPAAGLAPLPRAGVSQAARVNGAPAASSSGQQPKPKPTRWSTQQFYKAVEQVYPVEEQEPRGLLSTIKLRPYQKQSLAFMKAVENSTEARLAGQPAAIGLNRYGRPNFVVRGGWLCDEMGMGKTAVVTALVLANKAGRQPAAASDTADNAASSSSSGAAAASSSEQKPAAASAASAASTSEQKPSAILDQSLAAHPPADGRTHLKLTLVVVNNTLVQQWEEEVRKFAPKLRVHVLYQGAGGGREAALRELSQTDVLITTPHAKWPPILLGQVPNGTIERLVVDESHLLSGASWKGQRFKIRSVPARSVWCVTGTPFSSGIREDLLFQAELLGHGTDATRSTALGPRSPLGNVLAGTSSSGSSEQRAERALSNEEIVDALKLFMIRHTKAQRIGGHEALALPDADCSTVWLDLSADEKLLYDLHACKDGEPRWAVPQAVSRRVTPITLDDLTTGINLRRMASCHMWSPRAIVPSGNVHADASSLDGAHTAAAAAFRRLHVLRSAATADQSQPPEDDSERWEPRPEACTKYKALLSELRKLRRADPKFRAVVFTAFNSVQEKLVKLIEYAEEDYRVFEFNGSTPPLRRHKLIHDFQNGTTEQPCVFVVTFATAAVGITLTRATAVFLMEPALDPAQEAQAAGRIHRLGQTKEIFIKRFAFRRTIDEAIASLHDKVRDGKIAIVDKEFPPEVIEHFIEHGVARPHAVDESSPSTVRELGKRTGFEASYGYADGQEFAYTGFGRPSGVTRPDTFVHYYKATPCTICGCMQKVDDSVVWFGQGNMRWLTGITGCPRALVVPLRPKSAAEAAAMLGNDPARAAEVKAVFDVAMPLILKAAIAKVKKLEAELQEKEKILEGNPHSAYSWQRSSLASKRNEIAAAKEEVERVKRHIARGPTTAPASASSAGLSSLGGSSSGGQGAGKASATSFPSSGGGSSFGGSSSPFAGSSSFGSSSGGGVGGSFTFSRDAYGRLKGHYKQRLGNGESYKAFKKLLRATQEAVGKLGRTTEIYGEKSGAPAHAVAKSEVSNALRKMTGVLIRSRSLADAFGALLPNDALKAQWRSMQL